jgi:hypothetical protein
MDLQEVGWWVGAWTGLIWLMIGTCGACSRKKGKETLGYIKYREFLE